MRAGVHQSLLILTCFILLLGAQSQSDVVFHVSETEDTELSPSANTRFLQQYRSIYCSSSTRCQETGTPLHDTGDSATYVLAIGTGGEVVLDIPVSGNKMAFALELDSSYSVRTNIKVNPSDSWPNNAVPAVTGAGWRGDLKIPSSSSSSRVLRFEIKSQSGFFSNYVSLQIVVTSSESSGIPFWAIIIIVGGVVGIAVAICAYVKMRRNRRLASQRASRVQIANQSNNISYSQQPQQMYNQGLQPIEQAKPMYNQQPQMYMQPQEMYPQQMYAQQPQMYPQQQMYAQQPMYQQYPQMYQQQQPQMVIQVGQVGQLPQ